MIRTVLKFESKFKVSVPEMEIVLATENTLHSDRVQYFYSKVQQYSVLAVSSKNCCLIVKSKIAF
jgi:hypothetical protein